MGDVSYHIEPRAAFAEVQLDASGVPNESDSAVDDVLQNGFKPPSANGQLLRRKRLALEHLLPEHAQEIERHHGAKQDDLVGA